MSSILHLKLARNLVRVDGSEYRRNSELTKTGERAPNEPAINWLHRISVLTLGTSVPEGRRDGALSPL